MIQRITISFVGVVAVFGLAQPTFGDANCAQFAAACAHAPIGTFTQEQVEGLGGTFVALMKCGGGDCEEDKTAGPATFCSPNLDENICTQLIGPPNTGEVPAVSEWGVAVMALVVVTIGTIVLMRRRTMVST